VLPIREHVPLAPYTTLGIGGQARFLAEARSPEDVRELVSYAEAHDLKLFVMGGGSNLVVSDLGWTGIILHVKIEGILQYSDGGRVVFEAGAGENWDTFVAATIRTNFGGLECLSGIPGMVGGTPIQNVGAYGQEVADTIVSVTALDRENGEIREIPSAACGFAYRSSMFNSTHRDRYIVLRVAYSLLHNAPPKIDYADLQKVFANRPKPPSLQEVRDAVRKIRASKGMLLVDGDPDVHSAGSFFKNPVVTLERFLQLDAEMKARGLQFPSYMAGEGHCKLSAAWLVEKAGFHKGYVHGNVGISSKHTLAIINRGGAKASEVVSFMNVIRDTVYSRFQVDLQPEPVFVGFDHPTFPTR
jgi:UDP-N-acetylmuramate dehydrogenase